MKELIEKVSGYTSTQRIQRLIQISVKEPDISPLEILEMSLIQGIREANGELEAVRKQQQINNMEAKESKNLNEGLIEEINRVKGIVKEYEGIGNSGLFAASFMNLAIKKAEYALGKGEVVDMVKSYNELREYEL